MTRRTLPPLVLLAPYGAEVWVRIRDALAAEAEVLIVDPAEDSSLHAMARHVLGAAPSRFHLAGLCLGGYLAFEIHRLAPERIAGLALINTSAAPDSDVQGRVRKDRIDKLKVLAKQGLPPSADYVAHAVNWLLGPQGLAAPQTVSDASALLAATPVARSLAQQQAMLARPDSRPGLKDILVPTLVVAGECDRVCAPSSSVEIARGVAGADISVLEGCGHLAPIEKPEQLSSLMTGWLRRTPSGQDATREYEEQV